MREHHQATRADAVSYLLRDKLEQVAVEIEALSKVTIGRGGRNNWILRRVTLDQDYMKIAFIGVKTVFEILMEKEQNTIARICNQISYRLEGDLKCQIFRAMHPVYVSKVERSFNEHNVNSYKHRHNVLMSKFREFEYKWAEWTAARRIKVGQRVLSCILKVFKDVMEIGYVRQGKKSRAVVNVTPEFKQWEKDFERARGYMFPALLPLKIKPREWSHKYGGGYYTTNMITKTPFIKTRGRDHKKWVNQFSPEEHYKAVNKLQGTPWRINKKVLEIQNLVFKHNLQVGLPSNVPLIPPEFPEHLKDIDKEDLTDAQRMEVREWKIQCKTIYGKEQKRKGKVLSFMQAHKLANELSDWGEMYFVFTCDFRGRIYCATSGLSPQGADSGRGLLQFAKGMRVGKDGIFWTAVAGANLYGVDKVSLVERVEWVTKHREHIQRVVNDPLGSAEFWGNADKPYQFLAFCYEWQALDYGDNPNAIGHMYIGLDGSCNGIQHYSAMLKDEVGAKATNLINSTKPEDIYGEVARVCIEKLRVIVQEEDSPLAKKWLEVGVTRKCAKRPVMTLPYGATKHSARHYIMEYVVENWPLFKLPEKHQWECAVYLTPILWASIGEVVKAPRVAMAWIRNSVKNNFMAWVTPIGFPVYQYYKDVPSVSINTELNGSMQISCKEENARVEAARRFQKSGIAPNFIHSIDSTHLVMTLNSTNFHSYTTIHDDYGTHAGNTEKLYKAIRESFLKLYTEHSPLEDWAEQVGRDVKTIPRKGDYDVKDILEATYFFS